jgi:hypothetical protein
MLERVVEVVSEKGDLAESPPRVAVRRVLGQSARVRDPCPVEIPGLKEPVGVGGRLIGRCAARCQRRQDPADRSSKSVVVPHARYHASILLLR